MYCIHVHVHVYYLIILIIETNNNCQNTEHRKRKKRIVLIRKRPLSQRGTGHSCTLPDTTTPVVTPDQSGHTYSHDLLLPTKDDLVKNIATVKAEMLAIN